MERNRKSSSGDFTLYLRFFFLLVYELAHGRKSFHHEERFNFAMVSNFCYLHELFDSFDGYRLGSSMSFLNLIMNLNVGLSF